jgi:hypothetical protein
MRRFLIPCFSTMPDREHDCVVLGVDDDLLETLSGRLQAFDMDLRNFPDLYRHEHRGGRVYLINPGDNMLDAPDGVVELDPHVRGLGIYEYTLEPAHGVYLSVAEDGFFYTFDGQYNKHGPSEEYFTETFTLDDLKGETDAQEPPDRTTESHIPGP